MGLLLGAIGSGAGRTQRVRWLRREGKARLGEQPGLYFRWGCRGELMMGRWSGEGGRAE